MWNATGYAVRMSDSRPQRAPKSGPGPGSVNPDAVRLAREAGMLAIDGGCPCMFDPTADMGHKIMRPLLKLAGNVPRHV